MCPVHCTTEDKFCLGKMENGIKIKRDNCFSNNGNNHSPNNRRISIGIASIFKRSIDLTKKRIIQPPSKLVTTVEKTGTSICIGFFNLSPIIDSFA